MSQVFVGSYKDVVARAFATDMTPFARANMIAEELCEAKDANNDYIYDYGTITKGILEAYGIECKP